MKTLIFVGSPRKKGHSMKALELIKEQIDGEVEVIDAYKLYGEVRPCVDCRYCWKNPSCAIKTDVMHSIYDKVEEANNIILISPLYFASAPGPLKIIIDRLQVYWACSVRGDGREENTKNGFSVIIGGAPEYENQFVATELLATNMFKDLFVNDLGSVHFSNSDNVDLKENEDFVNHISEMVKQLNENVITTEVKRIVNY